MSPFVATDRTLRRSLVVYRQYVAKSLCARRVRDILQHHQGREGSGARDFPAVPAHAEVRLTNHQTAARAHDAGHLAGSSIFFNQVESHSLEQSALEIGLSASYMGHSVKSSLQTDRTVTSNTLTATFTQKMFTTSLVLPPATATQEARNVLDGIRAVLAEADMTMDDLVYVQIF